MNKDRSSELIQSYFLGCITADEMVELDRLLKDEATLRAQFAATARLESNLRDAASSMPAECGRSRHGARDSKRHVLVGLRAAAVITLCAILVSQIRSGVSSPPIARVVELNGSATWIAEGEQTEARLEAGAELTGGTLEVSSVNSWAEFVFTDGSSVWVSGPAAVSLSDGEAGKLIRAREGYLSLDVSPQPAGRPMRVITPSAEAVVLGTRFNIAASSSSTRLTVNEGRVRITRLADGRVQDVSADQRVVAALEQDTEFEALSRGDSVNAWRAEFPRDLRQGQWLPGNGAEPGSIRAEAHLFRGDRGMRNDPILLYTAVVGPSNGPVVLSSGAHIRIRGRLERDFKVSLGIGTHFPRGGFAGKYSLVRELDIDVDRVAGGHYELDLPLDDFARENNRFPVSASGQELVWLWIQTVKQDAGLEIISVELITGSRDEDP